ncbi:methylase of polypeptide chain release factor [Plasmopara halstedii]|uniref:Methylase of polypeptide chain release factor n=1 Tax=Plasmopara halstedii TaxID=4781 RepID=A0A0P1AI93_PLAHL|nr:methylase of polypeptide chain release factor [Plasmopara halstedii]CEG40736.1 methylase of polypeptide chain release factor [Plasmopara halstedii]|eukprot:XP_024577105.1 methylase of polypeptide chain release factor [Plasmopara halstedii]
MFYHHRHFSTKVVASRRLNHHGQSLLEAVQKVRARLCSVPTAHSDAKALVANAVQPPLASSNDVYFEDERKLTRLEAAELDRCVERRLKGEPLAYITGRKWFWSLEFNVSKDTLIPRSDSEVLIETLVEEINPETPLKILDIGTGSGCLLLSALSEFPHATGVGIDVCPRALAVAKQNAISTDLATRATFLLRDLSALPGLSSSEDKTLCHRFDVILCNPPYIPRQETDLVEPEVLNYEPHLALFADGGSNLDDSEVDPEGLRMYRIVYESVDNLFRSDAKMNRDAALARSSDKLLILEVGSEKQAQAVRRLFSTKDPRKGLHLHFKRFLFDACGKYRGILFLAQ